ncbi:MAG: hypothetical protein R6V47_06095 [Candidatus Delongbacteria bacterium]
MIKELTIIIVLTTMNLSCGFSKGYYTNYNRHAANLFINGMYYEFYSDFNSAVLNYQSALGVIDSDHIRLREALGLMHTEKDRAYNILEELFEKDMDLGRFGIHIYLNMQKEYNAQNSQTVLKKISDKLIAQGEVMTAGKVLKQLMEDRQYSFLTDDEFENFISNICFDDLTKIHRIYFRAVETMFMIKTGKTNSAVTTTFRDLESVHGILPYSFYRMAFLEYISEDSFDMAKFMLDRMNRITYGEANYYFDNAEFYKEKNDYGKAITYLLEGLREFKDDLSLRLQLGEIYLSVKKYSNAEIIFSKILEEYPKNIAICRQIANIYHGSDDFLPAVEFYEKAIKRFPSDAQLLNNYSYLLAQNSTDLKKAMGMVDKAIKIEPESIIFLDTKAWIFFQMRKYEQAEQIVENIFSSEELYYHQEYEELFEHYKEIKTALNKAEELNNISINRTVKKIGAAIMAGNYILETGLYGY